LSDTGWRAPRISLLQLYEEGGDNILASKKKTESDQLSPDRRKKEGSYGKIKVVRFLARGGEVSIVRETGGTSSIQEKKKEEKQNEESSRTEKKIGRKGEMVGRKRPPTISYVQGLRKKTSNVIIGCVKKTEKSEEDKRVLVVRPRKATFGRGGSKRSGGHGGKKTEAKERGIVLIGKSGVDGKKSPSEINRFFAYRSGILARKKSRDREAEEVKGEGTKRFVRCDREKKRGHIKIAPILRKRGKRGVGEKARRRKRKKKKKGKTGARGGEIGVWEKGKKKEKVSSLRR